MSEEGRNKGLKEFSGDIVIMGPDINNACTAIDFRNDGFDEVERIFYTLGRWLVSRETLPDRNKCRIVEMELMSDFIDGVNDILDEGERKT